MTVEEAAEELLRAQPFQPCAGCGGKGGWRIHDEVDVCPHCRGSGVIYRAEYLEACRVLEEAPQSPPESDFQRENREIWEILHEDATVAQKHYYERREAQRLAEAQAPKKLPSFFPNWGEKK